MPKPYQTNDKWSQKAASEGYRARSVYKLMELDERFGLLKPGMSILDCGAAPGSWAQLASEKIGPKGKIIGIDLTEIEPIADNVKTYHIDIHNADAVKSVLEQHGLNKVDLVLSDIAPSTSGVKDVDQWRSIELTQAVLALADQFLKTNGRCVLKVFRGADFDEFLNEMKQAWKKVKVVIVKASRDRSREVYIVCQKV